MLLLFQLGEEYDISMYLVAATSAQKGPSSMCCFGIKATIMGTSEMQAFACAAYNLADVEDARARGVALVARV